MQKYRATRMCIACRTKTYKDELYRFVLQKSENVDKNENKCMQNDLLLDKEQKKDARGYYLCQECFEKGMLAKIKLKKPKNKKV